MHARLPIIRTLALIGNPGSLLDGLVVSIKCACLRWSCWPGMCASQMACVPGWLDTLPTPGSSGEKSPFRREELVPTVGMQISALGLTQAHPESGYTTTLELGSEAVTLEDPQICNSAILGASGTT